MFKALHKEDKGFTLVELMVVVLIIGILVAIAVPIFNNASKKAKENSCKANIRTIEGAVSQKAATDDVSPDTINVDASTLAPAYLKEAPKCPIKDTAAYTVTNGQVIHNHAN